MKKQTKSDRVREVLRQPNSQLLTNEQVCIMAGCELDGPTISRLRKELGVPRIPGRGNRPENGSVGTYKAAVKTYPGLHEWLLESCPPGTTLMKHMAGMVNDIMKDCLEADLS